jgi:hypothetical protein
MLHCCAGRSLIHGLAGQRRQGEDDMICRKWKIVAVSVAVLWAVLGHAQTSISASEASHHVGEYSKVCGLVASTHFAYRSRGAPTFINLDRPYPNQVFVLPQLEMEQAFIR